MADTVQHRVLVLAPHGRDAQVIAEVLGKDSRECVPCRDVAALHEALNASAGAAVIALEALAGPDVAQLFDWLDRQPSWSDFPLVLLAAARTPGRTAPTVAMLERLGNLIVLERPLHAETLRRAVASSLRARLRQYEARRQLAEREAEQERLHLALAAGRLGSWAFDIDSGELRATDGLHKIFGGPPNMSFAGLLATVHPEDRAARQAAIDACIANNTDLTIEYRLIWPDGSIHWVQSRGHLSRSPNGGGMQLVGVSLDITDRHESNQKILATQNALERLNDTLESRIAERTHELAAANDRLMKEIHERAKVQAVLVQSQKMEALGQLTGGIAHDFNNLLNVIMGNAELITRLSSDERVRTMAQTAKRATERGAKLTGQLLTFSRSGNLDLKSVDAVALLLGMRDMLAVSVGTGIHFATQFDVSEAWTLADANQLELAILNLAINARDAMPEPGLLKLKVSQRAAPDHTLAPGDYVVVSVQDSGTGIAPDILSRVFDPFFTTKPVGKGTGLGLSQVYGIARQAGGIARIDSELGVGTTVEIWLPVHEKAAVAEAREHAAEARAGGNQRILVIEDDPDVRTFLVDCLDMLGYSVSEASHGRAGLERLAAEVPDLIVVDFAMPGMSGLDVISEVRRTHPALPIILATGYADVDVSRLATQGCTVLRKPFQIDELARTVQQSLNG